jgi:hypothetical protein
MRAKKHLVIGISACAIWGGAVDRAFGVDFPSISYSDTLGFTHPHFVEELAVPQFDSALGTLSSVTLEIALGQESTVKGELLNPELPGLHEYDLDWNVTLTGLGGQTLLELLDVASSSGGLTAFDGSHDYDGTSGFTDFYASDASDTLSYTEVTPGFGSFIGTGSMSFIIEALANLSLAGTGAPFDVVHETGVTAHVEVTYEYLPIPEPVSLAFFGAGALVAVMRRRD